MYKIAVIMRPKPFVFGGHQGVLLPNGLVAHCTPECGEHISTLADYANGCKVDVVRYVPRERHEGTIRRIAAAMQNPKPWVAGNNNCQHFVNRMTDDPETSPAVVGALVVAGLAGFVALSART